MLLRDPFDENVLPIVEELQRRLPEIGQFQGEEDEQQEANNDADAGEQNGSMLLLLADDALLMIFPLLNDDEIG